ncbi:MAG TPA: sigma 54-interacting transcriptional regulator [Thermoanaerobaculia bacterium]|nr:sigma 54-interacting transcriptional regulator [Thermoanaerobaculia bacterium]
MFTAAERALAVELSGLAYVNPFLATRIEHERRILGSGYIDSQSYWSLLPDLDRKSNVDLIDAKCAKLVESLLPRLDDASAEERELYEGVVYYFLYELHRESFLGLIERDSATQKVDFYQAFARDVETYLPPAAGARAPIDVPHLFACFFQLRRAFHHIFRNIVGRSLAAARLRANVWESIFTNDIRRYRRSLYSKMTDVATLITGPTGTGKELVARAIALSRYMPFDERRERFVAESAMVGFNLAALSPTLIESELFGHRKGAFTGAIDDHTGFLESCGPHGTVFLDEIGEVDAAVQVKLLRVIQTRTLQRIGDTTPRKFEGKIIAATNRDLAAEIRAGRFREDFFYRLCADAITTPALREQLTEPGELHHLARFISARVAGEQEADALATQVVRAIETYPGLDYPWPGNFRELEQCVRSVMLRGSYRPAAIGSGDARLDVANAVLSGELTADELLRKYCTLLYAKTRNYSHVAERLGVDRRTVRARIDAELLSKL